MRRTGEGGGVGREIMQKPLTLDIEILEIFATKPEGTSRALLMRKEANDAVTDGDVVGLLLILDVGGAKGSGRRGRKKGRGRAEKTGEGRARPRKAVKTEVRDCSGEK